jgi:hypothetical protein
MPHHEFVCNIISCLRYLVSYSVNVPILPCEHDGRAKSVARGRILGM